MFNENLIESSPARRRRRHWPTFAAFAIQLAIAGALLIIPLFYVGVLPVTHRDRPTPIADVPLIHNAVLRPASAGGGGGYFHSAPTVQLLAWNNSGKSRIPKNDPGDPSSDQPPNISDGVPGLPPGLDKGPGPGNNARPDYEKKRVRRSSLDEGLLISKVVPEYPIIAKRTGVQGDVKLHAIIGRDGTIQSLSLIGGHPLLVVAAMDAVKQWRYRPYVLNGDAVEVETYITVNFRRTN